MGERKDEVSVAVEGSKGAVWTSVEEGEEDGLLPVKASQNDMLTVQRRGKTTKTKLDYGS